MGFWEWASTGDNLLCLAFIVAVTIVATVAIVKGKDG